MSAPATREAWLLAAAEALTEPLAAIGETVPELRVSVGFPGGSANRKKTIGQCWPTMSAADGVPQIFISPIRGEEETVDVLGTLLHEMIHAIDDCQDGHRKNFARIAKAVGFVPKLTQSGNRSDDLNATLKDVADRVGPFPHATLMQGGRGSDTPKTQTTRMLKVECPVDGYTLRTTQKWLDFGLPTCPCGEEMVTA
jgi:hypothetical protein